LPHQSGQSGPSGGLYPLEEYLTQSIIAAAIDDTDAAIGLAHQSCDEREPLLVLFARNSPNLRRLRDDPRFADVRRRLALPNLDS
jgi:hypothetical protein